MGRGRNAKEGDTRISANGYHYTRTKDKWRLTHHLIAEKVLGRSLKNNERVYFVDGDRSNLSEDNIRVQTTINRKEKRIRDLKTRIKRDQEELRELLRDS